MTFDIVCGIEETLVARLKYFEINYFTNNICFNANYQAFHKSAKRKIRYIHQQLQCKKQEIRLFWNLLRSKVKCLNFVHLN